MRFPSAARRRALLPTPLFATALAIPFLVTSIAQPWHVMGGSMEPSLADGSILLVDALVPPVAGYVRGDIVIIHVPPPADRLYPVLVKRIVAIAGDHVQVHDGRVVVNGTPIPEPYLAPATRLPQGDDRIDLVVPPGDVYVLGDRRANSFDSRSLGPLPLRAISGRAWLAIGPGWTLELPGAAAAGN